MHSDGGPGNMHLINGLYDCLRNRVTGARHRRAGANRELGSAYFQESGLMGDFLTIRQLKLPVKIVLFNNGSLGFVELEMKAAGLLEYGTTLDNPDFAKMAETIGIRGIGVEDPSGVPAAIQAAFAHEGPVLIGILREAEAGGFLQ